MKLALLSDLHLAMPGHGCPFTHDVLDLPALLDDLLATHDLIVLGGDVYDPQAGTHLLRPARALRDTRAAWPDLASRLDHPRVLSITGNHDHLLRHEGVPDLLTLHAAGTTVAFLHGHQLKPLHRLYEHLKYPIKWLAARDQRTGSGALGRALYSINRALRHRPDQPDGGLSRAALHLLATTPALDILVCGHTHRAELIASPHGLYINTGACSFGQLDWVSLDLRTRHATLHHLGGPFRVLL